MNQMTTLTVSTVILNTRTESQKKKKNSEMFT